MIETMIEVWLSGGWVMIPIFLLAIALYTSCAYLFLELKIKNINQCYR